MSEHGSRFEDKGVGLFVKYWAQIVTIFLCGALYQAVKANATLTAEDHKVLTETRDRITRVEDAVLYLKELAEQGERPRQGHKGP